MKNRDEILAKAKILVSLLEENETGLFTWHEAVHNTIAKINLLYSGEKNETKNWKRAEGGEYKRRKIGVDVYPLRPSHHRYRCDEVCLYENYPNSSGMASSAVFCTLQEFINGKNNDLVINDMGIKIFNEILEHVKMLLKEK